MGHKKWSKIAQNKKYRRVFTNLAQWYNEHAKKCLLSTNTRVGKTD